MTDADLLWLECHSCRGSGGGEGYWRCGYCHGTGSVRNEAAWREREIARADRARDEAKDRRATGDG